MVSDTCADRDRTALALCQFDLPRAAFVFEMYLTLPAVKGILSFWSAWEEEQPAKGEMDCCMANVTPWRSREQKGLLALKVTLGTGMDEKRG